MKLNDRTYIFEAKTLLSDFYKIMKADPALFEKVEGDADTLAGLLLAAIPMVAWAATLIAMKGYSLTGEKMKEIQAVNACRRDAVANGMKLEDAMEKWQTVNQLPAEYRA